VSSARRVVSSFSAVHSVKRSNQVQKVAST
jgi:hypothetical protein